MSAELRYDESDLELAGATGDHYRRQAQRLLGLASSSPFDDAKAQFLDLALHYESLAAHAARDTPQLTMGGAGQRAAEEPPPAGVARR